MANMYAAYYLGANSAGLIPQDLRKARDANVFKKMDHMVYKFLQQVARASTVRLLIAFQHLSNNDVFSLRSKANAHMTPASASAVMLV